MSRHVVDGVQAPEPVCLIGTASVTDAARAMSTHDREVVLVVDAAGHLIGLLTAADIVSRIVASGRAPEQTALADIATAEVITAARSVTSADAALLCTRHRVDHLPVLDDDGRPVGVWNAHALLSTLLSLGRVGDSAGRRTSLPSRRGSLGQRPGRSYPEIVGGESHRDRSDVTVELPVRADGLCASHPRRQAMTGVHGPTHVLPFPTGDPTGAEMRVLRRLASIGGLAYAPLSSHQRDVQVVAYDGRYLGRIRLTGEHTSHPAWIAVPPTGVATLGTFSSPRAAARALARAAGNDV
jgi:CBS domain-containing protein